MLSSESIEIIEFHPKIEPPITTLQNALKTCSTLEFVSVLCDFDTVVILQFPCQDVSDINKHAKHEFLPNTVKKLVFKASDQIGAHVWSRGGNLFAVAGLKVYVFDVCFRPLLERLLARPGKRGPDWKANNDFQRIFSIQLDYVSTDISLASTTVQNQYRLAISGPNGVQILTLVKNLTCLEKVENVKLNPEWSVVLVEYSSESVFLAMAALDGQLTIVETDNIHKNKDLREFSALFIAKSRITDISFSDRSQMICIACWNCCIYVFKKVFSSTKYIWENVYKALPAIEKVCGRLPGSFGLWNLDRKSLLFLKYSDLMQCELIQYNTDKQLKKVVYKCSENDYIKGMGACRWKNKAYCIAYTRQRKIIMVSID